MKLKVATVQMISSNNDFVGNCARAEAHIQEAVRRGARLILLPEFALAGYTFTDGIWDMAEPLKGRTYRWLKGVCERQSAYIGTCILEQHGDDLFDTFILAGPGEGEFWHHRKIEPASYEAFFFKGGGLNPNVFATPLGRIGIAICFDTTKTHTIASLRQGRPDLVLLPYSCPGLPWFCLPADRRCWIREYHDTPAFYASYLHVPVVTSNKTGSFASRLPWMAGLQMKVDFVDQSAIVDRHGKLLAALHAGPGVLVEEVETGYGAAQIDPLPPGRWFIPFTSTIRAMMDATFLIGGIRYRLSRRRKMIARRVASS